MKLVKSEKRKPDTKARDFFSEVSETGTAKVVRSIEAIKQVCDQLVNAGEEIYATKVGRECERQFNSPKVNSIQANKVLLEYIRLREMEQKKAA